MRHWDTTCDPLDRPLETFLNEKGSVRLRNAVKKHFTKEGIDLSTATVGDLLGEHTKYTQGIASLWGFGVKTTVEAIALLNEALYTKLSLKPLEEEYVKRDALLKSNRKKKLPARAATQRKWVFNTGGFTAKDLQGILAAMRVKYRMLNPSGLNRTLILPQKGHEKAIRMICTILFRRVSVDEAEKLLKKRLSG